MAEATRTAFIGDVGGHREPFEQLLSDLGCDTSTGTIPPGLTIVQLGDLIHRGPDSLGVLELVARFIEHPRYKQLGGNHDLSDICPTGPMFGWAEEMAPGVLDQLTQWWEADLLRLAWASPPGPDGVPFLATHAGLTPGFASMVGADPYDAAAAAETLNDMPRDPQGPVWWAEGEIIGSPSQFATPLWASAQELSAWVYASALGTVGFHQVVGHSSPINWQQRATYMRADGWMLVRDVHEERRHVRMSVSNRQARSIHFIDPCHGTEPFAGWAPLIIEHPAQES